MSKQDQSKADRNRQLYRVPRVAELLDCSQKKVWKMIYDRRIDSVKDGRSRRVPATEIDRLIEEGLVPRVEVS